MSEIPANQYQTPEVARPLGSIASNTLIEPGRMMIGVQQLPNGELDFSRAAYVSPRAESIPEVDGLERVLVDATEAGVDESRLKHLSQMLNMLDKPGPQMRALGTIVRRDSLNTTADGLMGLAKIYKKEVIKSTEKGSLFHYHQTGIDNLPNILENGGLLSTDEQKRRGGTRKDAGSRPDVVQMTRDKYDSDGKLVAPGLKGDSLNLGVAGEVAFVIDQSIMDDPDYDGIVMYPNVPAIPMSKVRAIAVADPSKVAEVREMVAAKGLSTDVVSRQEWLQRQATSQTL